MEMVYMKNLPDADITKMLSAIKGRNEMLYDAIYDVLDSVQGVRKDILAYFAEHAGEFGQTKEHFDILSLLIERNEFTAEWYSWLNEYLRSEPHIRIDDIGILLNEAVEKNISLDELKAIVEGKESLVEVFPMLKKEENDAEGQQIPKYDEDATCVVAEVSDGLEPLENNGIVLPQKENSLRTVRENEPYFGLLNDMLTVMSGAGHGEKDSVINVQDNLNQISAKFQSALKELSAYSTEIVREWEKDRDEMERQKALYHIYQNIIHNQQRKINEMRNEINRLNVLRKAEKKRAQGREALNQKITELQLLATDIERNGSYEYLSGE